MAKDANQRKQAERDRKRSMGLARIECWVLDTPEHKDLMKRLESALRERQSKTKLRLIKESIDS